MGSPIQTRASSQQALGLFSGQYSHTVEPPCRVSLPAVWRPRLRRGLYLTKDGQAFPHLVLHTPESLAAWIGRFDQADPQDTETQWHEREFFRRLKEVRLDTSGRLVVPPELRGEAHISKEVTLIGVRNRIEIWSTEVLKLQDEAGSPPWGK